jgi:hypothetical protein
VRTVDQEEKWETLDVDIQVDNIFRSILNIYTTRLISKVHKESFHFKKMKEVNTCMIVFLCEKYRETESRNKYLFRVINFFTSCLKKLLHRQQQCGSPGVPNTSEAEWNTSAAIYR